LPQACVAFALYTRRWHVIVLIGRDKRLSRAMAIATMRRCPAVIAYLPDWSQSMS
jgi:hypothetical protein